MELPGLINVDPHDDELIVSLANMAGDSFLEELWTRELLSALPEGSHGSDRERFLSRAMIMNDIAVGAPYQGCYCTPNGEAMALGYLKSELHGLVWRDLEAKAFEDLVDTVLSAEEAIALRAQLELMEPVSVFDYAETHGHGKDFIHFVLLAVDPEHRGTGMFRQLITPFLDYADAQNIPCYLETYSDHLESLYGHFGFEVVRRLESPDTTLVERIMERRPRK